MQNYIEKVKQLQSPSFQQIRKIANSYILNLSKEESNALYKRLNRGLNLLGTHEEMCKYLYSFGNMHEAKIKDAVQHLPKHIFQNEFEIVDWGCGQGIGTVCFFDYLKKEGFNLNVKKVTLIEPSEKALRRAALHVDSYLNDNSKIQTFQKYLDEVTIVDIKSDEVLPVIHFFSNILDIKEIDLKGLANKINDTTLADNYIVSVGPLNPGNLRLDAFYNYFNVPFDDILHSYEISQFFYGGSKPCTYKAKVYKLEFNENGNLIPIEFYPSVQFHAAYQLDGIHNEIKQLEKAKTDELNKFLKKLGQFEVETPFDLGANVYEDVHPILAVLNNLVTRGVPTKSSPYIEQVFKSKMGYDTKILNDFELNYVFENKIGIDKLVNKIQKNANNVFSNEDVDSIQLYASPIAIARIQKVVLEALMTEKLKLKQTKWKILVEEKDVPCAAIAFKDLELLFNNLTQLSEKYQNL